MRSDTDLANPSPPTPMCAMIATFVVAGTFGALATVQTATLACRHRTVDACIPVFEGLFVVSVAAVIVIWLATSARRRHSIRSGLLCASLGLPVFAATLLLIGPVVCPDPGKGDVVCPVALPFAATMFAVVAIACWRLQKRSPAVP